MARKDRLQQDLDEKKLLMDSMMKHYGVPWELQKTVIASFPALLDRAANKSFEDLLEQLPDVVRTRLTGYCNLRLFKKISFFDDVPDREGLKLARCLQPIFCMPGDLLIEKGEAGTEMYFLLHGAVQVYIDVAGEPVVLATLRGGTFFGEMALMSDDPRKANTMAIEFSELLVLAKTDFLRLRRKFPNMFCRFEAEVARRREQTTRAVKGMAPTKPDGPVVVPPLACVAVPVSTPNSSLGGSILVGNTFVRTSSVSKPMAGDSIFPISTTKIILLYFPRVV